MDRPPTFPLQERDAYSDKFATSADIMGSNEVVTPEWFVVDMEQLPTQVEFPAISVLSPTPHALREDPFLIADQPTWKLPPAHRPDRVGNQTSMPATQTTGGESYFGIIRNLVKTPGVYAISPLASLLLQPFLTHVLSHLYKALAPPMHEEMPMRK